MTIATGSNSTTSIVKEITYGINPIALDGATTIVPRISDGANLTKGAFEDPTINGDRQSHFYRQGNREVGGDLVVAYGHENFDELLEGLFYSAFTANVLKIGSTPSSYTWQVAHPDIDQARMFTGVIPTSMSLEVNLDGVVQNTFSIMGADMELIDISTPPANYDETPVAAGDKQPFVHFDGTFAEGGVSACMTSITLNIDNGITGNYCLGDDVVKELSSNQVAVSGSISAYFEDGVLLNKFLNGTETTISFVLDDGEGNSHTWLLPKVIYSSSEVVVADGNQIPITLDFVALYDVAEGSAVSVTRTV